MPIDVKICGLTDDESVEAAVESGAAYLGFVFFPKSPRFIPPGEVAMLLEELPDDVKTVGLFVDPTDEEIDAVMQQIRLDMVQRHGTESPERVEDIRQEFAVEAIKAFGISSAEDLKAAEPYIDVADMLLFDAKPPKDADRPGGNAVSFDWSIMKAWTHPTPWLLAGGLTAANVAEAVRQSGAPGVDVSSSVERAPGEKDPALIRAFLEAVEGL
jgi:phosphoribosylanthranilate isomerase